MDVIMSICINNPELVKITFDLETMQADDGPRFALMYTLRTDVTHWLMTHVASGTWSITNTQSEHNKIILTFNRPEDEALFKLTWL